LQLINDPNRCSWSLLKHHPSKGAILTVEEVARFGPLGTVLVAFAALGVATWSLLAQKGVARRRAAIDFFLKTEMDEKLLLAYDKYRAGVDDLCGRTDFEEFCKTENYHHVRSYLNILELMAVGIENGTFDERICHVYWNGFVMDAMSDTAKLIDFIREEHNADLYFRSFRRLHYRWMTNPELPIRWQHRGRPLRRGPIPLTPTLGDLRAVADILSARFPLQLINGPIQLSVEFQDRPEHEPSLQHNWL
jgi:hypothetical protein